ncbi:universal stress protein [Halorarius halobius]|uniref:universal stress protein n=1 Tax=Halorarius halobius TaxID=2962671 RepID=UPI0020CD1FA0|nr:universal stress protein [Halorarius halobius]
MTRYLVAAASPETATAACDYLDGTVEDGDEVFVLTVQEEARPVEGRAAVSGVAQDRLAGRATVRTYRKTGTPDRVIVAFARERGVDQIVLGPNRGGDAGIGSTTRSVLATVDAPVFVVPG